MCFMANSCFSHPTFLCRIVRLLNWVREQRRLNSQMFIKLHFVSAVSDKRHYTGHLNIHIRPLHKMPLDGTWGEKHVCAGGCASVQDWACMYVSTQARCCYGEERESCPFTASKCAGQTLAWFLILSVHSRKERWENGGTPPRQTRFDYSSGTRSW